MGRADIDRLAREAGVHLTPEQVEALAALHAEADIGHRALRARLEDRQLGNAAYMEANAMARHAWLLRAYEVVPEESLVAMLGRDARLRASVPDAPGWPFWMRETLHAGLDEGRQRPYLPELIRSLLFLSGRRAFDEIDDVYRRIDTSRLALTALVAFLRTPYPYRASILEWVPLRERVRAELSARGKNPKAVLTGLGETES